MYARVVTNTAPKENLEKINTNIKEDTWPDAKKQKGYKGYVSVVDPETGERVTMSLWETKEDMLASEKTYFARAQKQSTAFGTKRISKKYYTVLIKD